jgi:hypothetical protein
MRKVISNRRALPGGGESFDVACLDKPRRKGVLTPADRQQIEELKREFDSRRFGGASIDGR